MQSAEQVLGKLFMEQQLKELAKWRANQARWNFAGHHRHNPSHAAWKKRRASGRH